MAVNHSLEVLGQWTPAPLPAAPTGEREDRQVLHVPAGHRLASWGTVRETVPQVVLTAGQQVPV